VSVATSVMSPRLTCFCDPAACKDSTEKSYAVWLLLVQHNGIGICSLEINDESGDRAEPVRSSA